MNLIFNFAEVLWYLSGSNSLDFIKYYAPSIAAYSMDSKTLTGTAYGPKIFTYGNKKINQWERVCKLLAEEDPDTKRAYIQIFDANEDLSLQNIDASCTLGLQFIKRKGLLHMIAFMRANDAFRGFLSDIFSFTFLQEIMARQLNCEVGFYYHQVGSMHIYHSDNKAVTRVIEQMKKRSANKYNFPIIPNGDNWPYIKIVLEYEENIRKEGLQLSNTEISNISIPNYWLDIIRLFNIYSAIQHRQKVDSSCFESLSDLFKFLIRNKWDISEFLSP